MWNPDPTSIISLLTLQGSRKQAESGSVPTKTVFDSDPVWGHLPGSFPPSSGGFSSECERGLGLDDGASGPPPCLASPFPAQRVKF